MLHRSDPNIAGSRRGHGGLVGTSWRRLIGWIRTNTFAPSWLPAQLRYPATGYLASSLVAGAAVALTLLFKERVPGFNVFTVLFLLAVVMVALLWGGGPSLLATLESAVLLGFFIYRPMFSSSSTSVGAAISLVLLLLVGILISQLTGQMAWARFQADQARREAEAHSVQLRNALAALVETKAQMDTFLGIASHELKTPLTSLKLSLQLSQRRLHQLTQGTNGAVAARDARLQVAVEQLNRTVHQMERMEALVNDLVDVSRIQEGKLELHVDRVDLVAIIREVVEEQREEAPGRTISFEGPAGRSQVEVSADAGRIEQVVTNFLTNALKYSLADRSVEIRIEVESEQARVWVRDQGLGLPLEEQEHIWERFHRVKGVDVQSGAGVGLGLGLYISRMIVERHNGQVGVQSVPGRGSTFWFTLPLPNSSEERWSGHD